MWKKHRSVIQDHVKYIHNDIVKPFRFGILQYSERVHEMHNLAKYLPPPSKKGVGFEEASGDVRDRKINKDVIRVDTKDRLPTSMQYYLEDIQEDYRSIIHEEWCDPLSTMEVKDNRKRSAAHINRLGTSKAAPNNYDSNKFFRVMCNKRAKTGVLPIIKHQKEKKQEYLSESTCRIALITVLEKVSTNIPSRKDWEEP